MKWPSRRNSLPKATLSCTSTIWNGERNFSNACDDRMKKPQSSVRYSVIAPGAMSPGSRSAIGSTALYGLETRALGLQHFFKRVEQRLGLARVVGRVIADVHVDRHRSDFRPSMNREMRFGEDHRAGDALRLELVETLADRGEAGLFDRAQAQSAQRAGVEHFRFCRRATIPLAQQMDSV